MDINNIINIIMLHCHNQYNIHINYLIIMLNQMYYINIIQFSFYNKMFINIINMNNLYNHNIMDNLYKQNCQNNYVIYIMNYYTLQDINQRVYIYHITYEFHYYYHIFIFMYNQNLLIMYLQLNLYNFTLNYYIYMDFNNFNKYH